jgi:serine protease Do
MYEYDSTNRRRGTMLGNILFTIIGSVIGGLIILALITSGIISFNTPQQTLGQTTPINGNSATFAVTGNTPVVNIAEKAGPAVVGILHKTDTNASHPWSPVGGGTGSGVIFDKRGYIVTNYHVVAQASKLEVVLVDGRRMSAKLVGTDELTDLAVVKIEAEKQLTVASFGDSDKLRVGELAVAIGNPMGENYYGSVTAGIISATRRTVSVGEQQYVDLLQTDAAINPGNSGGALVNAAGNIIGINSVKLTGDKIEGMGFAIPSNTVQRIVSDLVDKGKVIRPWLGVQYQGDVGTIPNSPKGIDYGVIVTPADQGPSQKAGMQPGDIIIAINGQKITTFPDLQRVVLNSKIGDKLEMTVVREQKQEKLSVVLEERPK